MHPLTFLIRSVVSPPGAIENLNGNALTWLFVPESNQIKNLKSTYRRVGKHYSTRSRGHCYELPGKTSALEEQNFFYRLLYRDMLSFNSAD